MDGWAYRCSLCEAVIANDEVRSHMAFHQSRPGWEGTMSYSRVDCTCGTPGILACEVPGHRGSAAADIARRL